MSKEERVREFLKGRYIACIATENDDKSMHMVSVWYLFQDGVIYVATNSRFRKARNIMARPRAGFSVDARKSAKECGASTFGSARIVEGDRSRALNARILERYLTSDGNNDPRVGPVFAAIDDITIEITPGPWTWWDCADVDQKYFAGAIAANNYILPLEG